MQSAKTLSGNLSRQAAEFARGKGKDWGSIVTQGVAKAILTFAVVNPFIVPHASMVGANAGALAAAQWTEPSMPSNAPFLASVHVETRPAANQPALPTLRMDRLGWRASDNDLSTSSLAVAGYTSLLGLLGLGRSAARKGSSRVRRLDETRESTPEPESQFSRIAQGFKAALELLRGIEPKRLLELAGSPRFQSANGHEQAVQLVELLGPGAARLAESAFHVLRMAEKYVPNFSASPSELPPSLLEDESFNALSAVERWAYVIEAFPDAVERLARLAHDTGTELGEDLKAYAQEKIESINLLQMRPAYQMADPARKAAQYIDTTFGVIGTKTVQALPLDAGSALGDVVAASRGHLIPMMASERLRILSRQGVQHPDDVARDIFNIGGERYQFDFAKEPSVASIGEAFRTVNVKTGEVAFFKLRKLSVNPRSLNRDVALLQGLLRVWVPKTQQTQYQGYVRDMADDLHKQIAYGNEFDQAHEFEETYRGQAFGGVHAFYASREGDVLGMNAAKGIPFSQLSTLPLEEQERAKLGYLRAMMHQIGNGLLYTDPTFENVFWDVATQRLEFIDMGSTVKLDASARLEMLESFLVMMSRDAKAMATTLIRAAERVTSDQTPDHLHAQLSDDLKAILWHTDWSPRRVATEIQNAAEARGIFGKTDKAGLMRAAVIVSQNLRDSSVAGHARKELLGALASNVSKLVREAPREAGRALGNVAAALGRQPAAFAQSAMELVGAEQLEKLASVFDNLLAKASFGMVGGVAEAT